MANHPNRSQQSVDAMARRIIRNNSLATIRATFSASGVSTSAIPDSHHPLVKKRQQEAFTKFEGAGSLSLTEAESVYAASMGPVAQANGATVEEALRALAVSLGEVK